MLARTRWQLASARFIPLPWCPCRAERRSSTRAAASACTGCRTGWGSLRADSNPNRTYNGSLAFAPFGERYSVSGTPAYAFTGARPDIVNDEYDFLLRKYHSTQGRWISPDPAGLGAAEPTNPQSWNRYAYVMNNPLAVIDPDGLGGPGSNCINGGGADSCPPADRNFHLMGDLASGCNATIDFGPLCFYPVGWDAVDWLSKKIWGLEFNTEGSVSWEPIGNGLELVGLGAANNGKQCPTGFGVGIAGGGNADAAVVAAGASATGSLGAGIFHNSSTGFSGGAFASGGAVAFAGSHVAGAPAQTRQDVSGFGLFGGIGASLFFTNAGSVQQLSGPFSTLNFNVGFSFAQLQVSYAKSGNIWYLQISPPFTGVSAGGSVTTMKTTTATTKGGC